MGQQQAPAERNTYHIKMNIVRKHTFFLFFIAAAALLQGCKKIEESINLGFNNAGDFPMPPNMPVNTPFTTPAFPSSFNLQEEMEKNNMNINHVKETRLAYLRLNIKSPSGHDFTFLKDIEVRLKKEGVGEKVVAWKYDVSEETGDFLDLDITDDVLDDYLKTNYFEMVVTFTTDKVLSEMLTLSYDLRVNVKANVFK
jgi:hypothetical protein